MGTKRSRAGEKRSRERGKGREREREREREERDAIQVKRRARVAGKRSMYIRRRWKWELYVVRGRRMVW